MKCRQAEEETATGGCDVDLAQFDSAELGLHLARIGA